MSFFPGNRSIKSVRLTAPRYWNLMGAVFLLVLLFILSLSVTMWMVTRYQRELAPLVGDAYPLEVMRTQGLYLRIFWIQIFSFLIGALALFGLTCHRISGTYLALKRVFRQVRDGDLSARLHFRKSDKLEDVAASFNEMMDAVESRHSDERGDDT